MSPSRHARPGPVVAGVLALALALPTPGRAAEVTRVATAFEAQNPFDLDLSVGFSRTQRRGKITRERHQDNHIADVIELRFMEIDQRLPLRLALGLFEDLELRVSTAVVFNQDRLWRYPGLDDQGRVITDAKNSTVTNNCIGLDGKVLNPDCAKSHVGAEPLFGVPGQSFRSGLANVTTGLTWAPMNDAKDDTKPKWAISFDYTAPTSTLAKPTALTNESSRGDVGDRIHRFAFATALSKKLGAIDPYAKVWYVLPSVGPGAYNNCGEFGLPLLGYKQNCGQGPWTTVETGPKPPHLAGFLFGAEFYAFDEPARHQRVGFDLQLSGQYTSEGRFYNELSDALKKLLYTEEYLSVGGSFGIYARASEFVQLRLNASLHHETEHFLTDESVGKDVDGACKGDSSQRCVDLDNRSADINPNFDFRYDMPGRRFRISEVNVFTIMATGAISF